MDKYIVTKEILALFLAKSVDELPEGIERLLHRAEDLVRYAVLNNLDENNEKHMNAFKKAVCAQVENWIKLGEDILALDGIKSYSLNDLSITLDENKNLNNLCYMARAYLNKEGLLYRGI